MNMQRIKVAILGATGTVGQRFIELLKNHPFFEVAYLCASEKNTDKSYEDVMDSRWKISASIPSYAKKMKLVKTSPEKTPDVKIAFSALDSSVATEVEQSYAKYGIHIVSNSKNHRFEKNVPILFPEVNPHHLKLLEFQKTKGKIITNSNCTIAGVTISLKPLIDNFGIEHVNLFSMQAISGSGYPGLSSMDILNNLIPYISDEEEKAELEPKKCLGDIEGEEIKFADFKISAHCNRVPIIDGHTVCVNIKLKEKTSTEKIKEIWKNFKGVDLDILDLPSLPKEIIHYRNENDRPQPKLDLNTGNGMTTVIGRLREDSISDFKYTVFSHNTIRGAAGAGILNAEFLYKKGLI